VARKVDRADEIARVVAGDDVRKLEQHAAVLEEQHAGHVARARRCQRDGAGGGELDGRKTECPRKEEADALPFDRAAIGDDDAAIVHARGAGLELEMPADDVEAAAIDAGFNLGIARYDETWREIADQVSADEVGQEVFLLEEIAAQQAADEIRQIEELAVLAD